MTKELKSKRPRCSKTR